MLEFKFIHVSKRVPSIIFAMYTSGHQMNTPSTSKLMKKGRSFVFVPLTTDNGHKRQGKLLQKHK